MTTANTPPPTRLDECPDWCARQHPYEDRAHYAARPKPIKVWFRQPDPLRPFHAIAARRSCIEGVDRVSLEIDAISELAVLTLDESRDLRDQLTAALNEPSPTPTNTSNTTGALR